MRSARMLARTRKDVGCAMAAESGKSDVPRHYRGGLGIHLRLDLNAGYTAYQENWNMRKFVDKLPCTKSSDRSSVKSFATQHADHSRKHCPLANVSIRGPQPRLAAAQPLDAC